MLFGCRSLVRQDLRVNHQRVLMLCESHLGNHFLSCLLALDLLCDGLLDLVLVSALDVLEKGRWGVLRAEVRLHEDFAVCLLLDTALLIVLALCQ